MCDRPCDKSVSCRLHEANHSFGTQMNNYDNLFDHEEATESLTIVGEQAFGQIDQSKTRAAIRCLTISGIISFYDSMEHDNYTLLLLLIF